ncbi:unnamed protein product [Fusarium graminearum]|nr:unnamed protein product [Fusarium graminearum]
MGNTEIIVHVQLRLNQQKPNDPNGQRTNCRRDLFIAERLAKTDRQLEAGATPTESWISDRDIIQDRWRNKMGVCDARTAQRRADRRSSWRKFHHELKPLTLAGNVMWNLDLVVEKSNPQVPCLSWNDISIVASHRIVSHLSDSVTNVDLNGECNFDQLACQTQTQPPRPKPRPQTQTQNPGLSLTWYQTKFTSFFLIYRTQVYLCLSPVADLFEPRNATMPAGVPAVSVHLGRAPLVPCRNPIQNVFFWGLRERLSDYPSSGGGPNTSRPRAIFTTIVQL